MNKILWLLVGVIIGTAVPFLCDWLMFGSIAPCRTIAERDNVTIQECGR